MKKIEAVISPSRLDAVRLALERGGICGKLTLTELQQEDANPPSVRTEGGSSEPLQRRIKIELIVSDLQADKIINVLLRHAPTDSSEGPRPFHFVTVCQVLQFAQPGQN
jgi:nitrogen regulatory protein PII